MKSFAYGLGEVFPPGGLGSYYPAKYKSGK